MSCLRLVEKLEFHGDGEIYLANCLRVFFAFVEFKRRKFIPGVVDLLNACLALHELHLNSDRIYEKFLAFATPW